MPRFSYRLLIIALFGFFLAGNVCQGALGWKIDSELKFHLAFFVETEPWGAEYKNWEPVPFHLISENGNSWAPDISNINLDAIRKLGFYLPSRDSAQDFTFYLKFFEFPQCLSPIITFNDIFQKFRLPELKSFPLLRSFAVQRDNLLVKKGFIAPNKTEFSFEMPFPAFLMPSKVRVINETFTSTQEYFNQHLPFSSIYLQPSSPMPRDLSPEAEAAWSAQGVNAFHNEISKIYARDLTELRGSEKDFRYFLVRGVSVEPQGERRFAVIKLPRKPMEFSKNFRDLPMPQNPERVFLSSLLLIHWMEFRFRDPSAVSIPEDSIESPAFSAKCDLVQKHILEVVSVVRF